jgi:hypothetical protein
MEVSGGAAEVLGFGAVPRAGEAETLRSCHEMASRVDSFESEMSALAGAGQWARHTARRPGVRGRGGGQLTAARPEGKADRPAART